MLDEFFRYFYVLGKGYILIPIVIYLAFLKREKLKPFILALVLESALVHILKFAFKAPRPASMLKDVYLLEPLYHKSFPSGDTAMAFLLACFFSQGASTPIKNTSLCLCLFNSLREDVFGCAFSHGCACGSYYRCFKL